MRTSAWFRGIMSLLPTRFGGQRPVPDITFAALVDGLTSERSLTYSIFVASSRARPHEWFGANAMVRTREESLRLFRAHEELPPISRDDVVMFHSFEEAVQAAGLPPTTVSFFVLTLQPDMGATRAYLVAEVPPGLPRVLKMYARKPHILPDFAHYTAEPGYADHSHYQLLQMFLGKVREQGYYPQPLYDVAALVRHFGRARSG